MNDNDIRYLNVRRAEPGSKRDYRPVPTRVPPELYERLRARSKADAMPMTYHVEQAVREYLDRGEKKAA